VVKRFGSIQNTAWTSGNLWLRSRMGGHWIEIIKKKHQELGRFWLNRPNRIFAEGRTE